MEIDDKLLLFFGTLMLIGGIVGLITNACTYEDKISELEKCMDKYKDYEYCKRYDSENSVLMKKK